MDYLMATLMTTGLLGLDASRWTVFHSLRILAASRRCSLLREEADRPAATTRRETVPLEGSHTRRMARIHGIDVVEDIVRGNPHIEFLVKVREKADQLVVVNWRSTFLQRDILLRIITNLGVRNTYYAKQTK